MKRNLLIAHAILMAAFFLVILGMRNPTLEQTSRPKQRPRAVVENVAKAPLSISTICHAQHLDADASPVIVVAAFPESRTFFTLAATHASALARLFVPSRASPAHLSRLT